MSPFFSCKKKKEYVVNIAVFLWGQGERGGGGDNKNYSYSLCDISKICDMVSYRLSLHGDLIYLKITFSNFCWMGYKVAQIDLKKKTSGAEPCGVDWGLRLPYSAMVEIGLYCLCILWRYVFLVWYRYTIEMFLDTVIYSIMLDIKFDVHIQCSRNF